MTDPNTSQTSQPPPAAPAVAATGDHQNTAGDRLLAWLNARALVLELAALALIILLAAVLRAYHLGYKSLWLDEVTFVRSAQMGPLLGPYGYASIAHPPGYLLLIRLLSSASQADWFLRLPAMLSGVAAVVALWALGRTLLGRVAGLLAAFLLALSALHLEYSQEAHSYALFSLLSTALLLLLAVAARGAAAERPAGRRWAVWIGFTAVSVLALYVHYYALAPVALSVLIFPCFLLAFSPGPLASLWQDQGKRRAMVALVGSLALVALLFLPQVVSQLSGSAAAAVDRAGAVEAGSLERGFLLSTTTFTDALLAFITNRTPWIADPLFVLAVAGLWLWGLAWLLWRRRAVGVAFLLWTLLPLPVLAWFAYQTGFSFAPRRLIFILPIFLLTVAAGMAAVASMAGSLAGRWTTRRGLVQAVSAATLAILALALVKGSLDPLASYYRRPKQDWRTMAHILESAATASDAVVILPNAAAPLSWYYNNPAARFISDGLAAKLGDLCTAGHGIYVASAATGKQPGADDQAYLAANFIRVPLKDLVLYYRNCQPGAWYGDGAQPLYQQAMDPFLTFGPLRASFEAYREAQGQAVASPLAAAPDGQPASFPTPPPLAEATAAPSPTAAATATPAPTATPQPTPTTAPASTQAALLAPDPASDLAAHLLAAAEAGDDPAAATRLAAYLVQSGDLDAASGRFAQAAALDPANSLAYNLWVQALVSAGQVDAAQTLLVEALAAFPEDPGLLVVSARLSGVPSATTADLQAALDAGRAALRQNDGVTAVEQGRLAVALAPDRQDAYVILGDGYRALGEMALALAAYRQAVAIAPHFSFLHARVSEILARQNLPDAALKSGLNAVAMDASRWENWLALGRAYAVLAKSDPAAAQPAQRALERAVELAPPETQAPQRALEELLAALAPAENAASPSPGPAAQRAEAEAALRAGRPQDALPLFQALVAADPADTASRMGAGAALAALGRVDEALAVYAEISVAQPGFPFAHVRRGELLEQQGDIDAALEAFRAAAEAAPQNADAQFALAFALRRAGLNEEAIAAFEAGLALDPARQAAQEALDALRAAP